MRRDIDTDLIRAFLAVIDQDGFIKASHVLGRSQSAVSMQMRRLEEAVDMPLFKRSGRKMVLTSAGETFQGYARRLVSLHDQALDALQENRIAGNVSLAVMGDYAANVLPGVLRRFIERYPDVLVDVTTGFSYDLIQDLGERFEIVLSTQPKGSLKGEVLRTERTRWAFSSRHVLPAGDVLPLALLPQGNMFREWAIQSLDKAGLRWRVAFTSSSIATVEAAAEAGIALAVVKEGSARAGLRLIEAGEGLPELPDSEITLHQSPRGLSMAGRLLADFLKAELKAA